MSKTKGLSKKKKLLKTLIHKYLPLQVLLTVFLYAVIVFINIPINKWLTLNCQKWSSGEYHFYDAFFILPFAELLIFAIMSAVICAVYYFVSGIIAYRNYCYIPLTEDEIKKKGFKNADEYFAYVCNMCSYGFKNEKENLQVSDDDLREMLITCLIVFPDNGTIFQIKPETAWNVSDDILFSEAVELNCGKAEIIDKHVVLSGDNRNGKREEYTV